MPPPRSRRNVQPPKSSGIVAPGKRVTKQKSNGHISASAGGASTPNAVSSPPFSVTSPITQVIERDEDGNIIYSRPSIHTAETPERKESGDVSEDVEAFTNGTANGSFGQNHRHIDVNAAKSPVTHDAGFLSLALTIIWSCPIADTIAILIFLLSLPPTFLAVTNTLFALLTFMPSATSISTIPTTLNEVFQGSGGTPSLFTIIFCDIVGVLLWLVIWRPAQVLALELAQAVVATTLGGGNSGKNKRSDYTIVCMGFVVISHIARRKWIPNRFFGYDWSVRLASLSNKLFGSAAFLRSDAATRRTYTGWARILITLHILIQGLVHMVRRWLAKMEQQRSAPNNKKSDPEAIIESPLRAEAAPPGSPSINPAVSQELTPRSSLPNMREPRDKAASNKKKKKQGNYVRSQQPLWAAFAATKVTVCREFDQSKVLQEASGSNAKDTKNLGSAPFLEEEGQVWVTKVRPNGFTFNTSYFFRDDSEHKPAAETNSAARGGINRSRPFYVRINGADWASTVIRTLPMNIKGDESADWQWCGEVFGLSPSSSYICSFVRSEDDVEIYTANVSTQSSPTLDQESSALATPQLQPHRPASPTTPSTTLKNSIAACEATLHEFQARQKKGKKDSKSATLACRKEIDSLNSRIAKIRLDDKAQNSRRIQWNQHMRQAEDAVAAISAELDSLNSMPDDDVQEWQQVKREWEEQKGHQKEAQEALFRCKDAAHQERSAVQAELTNMQQKRDRLTARGTKLSEQRERLLSATAEGLSEKERREAEIAAKTADRRQFEERSHEQATSIERSVHEAQLNAQQAWQQAQIIGSAYQQQHQQQQMMNAAIEEPNTPEGDLPGTLVPPSSTGASGFRFPAFPPTDHANLRGGLSSSFRHDNRSRSTSVLSGNSLYADFDDQDPAPPMPSIRPLGKPRGRQESASSGSGSGSGSGSSQRDPMSPANGGMQLSPAEKRGSPVWN